MEMHQLRYAVSVARLGSFSRAAEECRVAQPSLSQQIAKLEEELEERLFERGRKRTTLTPAGILFLPHAQGILENAEKARQEIRDMGDQVRGQVTLGILPTISPYFLPTILQALRRDFPGVEATVHEETTERILRGLEENELDLALISDAETGPRIETEELFREELLLCLPNKHPLVRQKKVVAADLQQEKFILMQEGHCLGAQTAQFCQTKGFAPRISCRSAQISTVQAMVQIGLGISLIPRMASHGETNRASRGVVYRSLDGTRPQRSITLALSTQRKPSRATLGLAGLIRLYGKPRGKI